MNNESIVPSKENENKDIAYNTIDMSDASKVSWETLLEISKNLVVSTTGLISRTVENAEKIAAIETHSAEQDAHIDDLTTRIGLREQSEVLSSSQRKTLRRAVNRRVYELLNLKRVNGKLTNESKRISAVYGPLFYTRIYSHLKVYFDVSEYADIKAIDFDEARKIASTWRPDEGIEELRREAEENWTINHDGCDVNEFLGRLL